jgi:hypothetical protein
MSTITAPRHKKTGTAEYVAFARRILRSYGKRARVAGELDVTVLEQLVELRAELDAQIEECVVALRTEQGGAYSWAQVAEPLGISRGEACKRFSRVGAARVAGGQPAELR